MVSVFTELRSDFKPPEDEDDMQKVCGIMYNTFGAYFDYCFFYQAITFDIQVSPFFNFFLHFQYFCIYKPYGGETLYE